MLSAALFLEAYNHDYCARRESATFPRKYLDKVDLVRNESSSQDWLDRQVWTGQTMSLNEWESFSPSGTSWSITRQRAARISRSLPSFPRTLNRSPAFSSFVTCSGNCCTLTRVMNSASLSSGTLVAGSSMLRRTPGLPHLVRPNTGLQPAADGLIMRRHG